MLKLPAMNFKAGWIVIVVIVFVFTGIAAVTTEAVTPDRVISFVPTPTVLPPNPAEIGWFQLGLNMTQGAGFIVAAFLFVGAYLWARKMMRGE